MRAQSEGLSIDESGKLVFKRCGIAANVGHLTCSVESGAGVRDLALVQTLDVEDMHGRHTTWVQRPVEVRMCLHMPQMSQQVEMDLYITSRSPGPLFVRRLDVRLDLSLQAPEKVERKDVTWFRNGWQSWSHCTTVGADSPTIPVPRFDFIYGMKEDEAVPRAQACFVSDMVSVVKIGDEGLLAGAIRQEHFQRIHVQPRVEDASMTLSIDLDGAPLAPGRTIRAGSWLLEGERTTTVLVEGWARRLAGGFRPREKRLGWSSWYERERKITHAYICRTVEVLATNPRLDAVRYVVVDDGYQRRVGDWLEPASRYGAAIADTARAIAESGRVPGIWLAPFIAQERSRLLAEHPDWLLRRGGKPVCGGWNPHWKARFYALDLDNAEVLSWLSSLFRELYSMGFRFFKLDYLYPAALRADRKPGASGRFLRFVRGLDAIRKAVTGESFILGCGAPLAPCIGLVDGMRVSTDVGYRWDSSGLLETVTGDPDLVGLFPAARNTLSRVPFARAFWEVDPDCLLVRKRNSRLSEQELDLYNSVAAVCGDLLFIGDDITRWKSREMERFTAILEGASQAVFPLSTSDQVDPAWVRAIVNRTDSLFCFNLGEYKEMASMSRDRLELLNDRLLEAEALGPSKVSLNEERISFSEVPARSYSSAAIVVEPGEKKE